MKTIWILMIILLAGCSASFQPLSSGISKADYVAGEQARAEQLKQIVANIAAALENKVDKPVIKVK
jgi:hypothetical protein